MASKEIRATATLYLDTKNAQGQAAKFVNDLKQKLNDIENAADRMTVFKDVVGYIGQIDKALGNLKSSNIDVFNNIFGNLDASLRKQLEEVFSATQEQLSQLDVFKEKINTFRIQKPPISEVRKIAGEINEFFVQIGAEKPFEKLEETFANKTNVAHIDMLSNALENFGMVFENVVDKLSGDFGFGGGSGGAGASITNNSNKIEKEIAKLEESLKKYQDIQSQFKSLDKTRASFDEDMWLDDALSVEYNIDSIKKLISAYNKADKARRNFVKSGDTSSIEYYENLKEMSELALKIRDIWENGVQGDDDFKESLINTTIKLKNDKTINLIEVFGDILGDAEDFLLDGLDPIIKSLDDTIGNITSNIREKTSMLSDDNVPTLVNEYDKLNQKVREYFDLLEKRKSFKAGTSEYNGLTSELDEVIDSLETIKSLDKDDMFALKDVLSDIEYEEITSVEDALKSICDILKIEIPSVTSGMGVNEGPLGKMISDAEYLEILTVQLQRLFENINTMSGTIEYKVLVNGQEIDIMQGGHKEVSEQTRVESYLGTLGKKRYVSAHNHPGGASSQYDKHDFAATINDVYHGIAAMGMVVGEQDITTLNLSKVKMEDALDVLEKIKKLDVTSVPTEKINEMFKAINPEYGEVAKTWLPNQLRDLAKYIHEVGESANLSTDPLEQFTNILKAVTSGKINLSKYQKLLDGFKKEDASSIFNQIMSAEGKKLQVQDTNTSSLTEFINTVKHQQKALVQLRNEANVTYSDIHDIVKSYMDVISSDGELSNDKFSQFVKQYFGRHEQGVISDWMMELENGQSSMAQVTNRIAGYFQKIDPSEYLTDATFALQNFFKLTEEIQNASLYSGDATANIEIGKYTARLEDARNALIRFSEAGQITSKEMKKVDKAFKEAQDTLQYNTKYYDSYYTGERYDYTYANEYEEERLKNEQLARENEELRSAVEKTSAQQKQKDDIASKNAILGRLEELYDPESYYSQEELEGILQDINAIVQAAQQEGDVADDVLKKYKLINAEITRRIELMKAHTHADNTFDKFYDLYDATDMNDLGEVTAMLETRQKMLSELSALTFENDPWSLSNRGDDFAEEVEKAEAENKLLEQRIGLLKQVEQGLIDINDVDSIIQERGSLEDKLSRLGDFIWQNGLSEKPERDADISEELEAFEEAYDRIILKLANGRSIKILPDLKGLNALAKFYDSDHGDYGETEIDDIIFERKQKVIEATKEQKVATIDATTEIKKLQDTYASLSPEVKSNIEVIRKYSELMGQVKSGALGAADAITQLNESISGTTPQDIPQESTVGIAGQIAQENEVLNAQKSIIEQIIDTRNDLGLNASQTQLGVMTDGMAFWSDKSTLDFIKEEQKTLKGCLQELVKIGEQKKKNGQLTEAEAQKQQELVKQIKDMGLSVRYKDGSTYNTASLDVLGSGELDEAIEQLDKLVSLRKKIDFGAYFTGTYGTFADTFNGSNVEKFVYNSINQFDDIDQFNSSIIGNLIREYQYLHEEMLECLLVGKEIPQASIDKMQWLENIDATKLEALLPKLEELQGKILTLQEDVDYNTVLVESVDYYDDKIQNLQTLIELQKEYLSLGGPARGAGWDHDLDYSTDELQSRLDTYIQFRDGAREIEKLKLAFPDVNLRGTPELAMLLSDLQDGSIQYQAAVDKVNQLLDEQAAKAKAAAEAEKQAAEQAAKAQQEKAEAAKQAIQQVEKQAKNIDKIIQVPGTSNAIEGAAVESGAVQKQRDFANANSEVTESGKKTALGVNAAAEAIKAEGDAATQAAQKKRDFVDANNEVAESGKKTADSINAAADAIKQEGGAASQQDKIADIKNILTTQEKLYNAKKKLAELDIKGQLETSEGMKASRLVDELQDQYDISVKLVDVEKQRQAIKDREAKLEREYSQYQKEQAKNQEDIDEKKRSSEQAEQIKASDQEIQKYYQSILDTVNKINELDKQIENAKSKNDTGAFTGFINKTQQEKGVLIQEVSSTLKTVADLFGNGIMGQQQDLAGARFFSETDTANLNAFLSSLQVQSALAQGDVNNLNECIRQLSSSFAQSEQIGAQAAESIAKAMKKASEISNNLFTFDERGFATGSNGIDETNTTYQEAQKLYNLLQTGIANAPSSMADWTAEQAMGVKLLCDEFVNLASHLDMIKQKQDAYFKGKSEYISGQRMGSMTVQTQEQKALNEQQAAYDKLKAKADEFARASGASGAIVTKFVEGADGISRLDFSVLDKYTSSLRKFSMEMGSLNTDKFFLSGKNMDSFDTKIKSAHKQMESIGTLLGKLREYGMSEDSSAISRLVEIQRRLEQEASKGSSASQSKLSFIEQQAKSACTETERLLKQLLQIDSATSSAGSGDNNISRYVNTMKSALTEMERAQSIKDKLSIFGVDTEGGSDEIKQVKEFIELRNQLVDSLKDKKGDVDLGETFASTFALKSKGSEIEKMIKQSERLSELIASNKAIDMGKGNKLDPYTSLSQAAQALVKDNQNATVELGKFDQTTNTLEASVVHANGAIESFKIEMSGLNGQMVAQQTGVGQLTNSWDKFKSTMSGMGKQLMTALVGANSFFEIISQVKKGIQYVKEIDLAMTELRKVTDATESSYAKFLDTAGAKAGKIGSTISDFTDATANFARLGYTIEESSKMAETAIVYKNVADGLDTVEASTDSIISTMMAYGIEADNTIGIVDRFNEVGKCIAQII